MSNPTTVLAFIQRILSPDSAGRKRDRSLARELQQDDVSMSDTDDTDALILHDEYTDTTILASERSIAEPWGQAVETFVDGYVAKRQKMIDNSRVCGNSGASGKLSTIEEGTEDEKQLEITIKDESMDVDASPASNDALMVDDDLWTWKGGNGLWR